MYILKKISFGCIVRFLTDFLGTFLMIVFRISFFLQKFRNPDQKSLRNSAIPPKPRYLFFQKKRARFEIDFSKKKKKKNCHTFQRFLTYTYMKGRASNKDLVKILRAWNWTYVGTRICIKTVMREMQAFRFSLVV